MSWHTTRTLEVELVDGDKVIAEERLLKDLNQRVREVQQAPDGALFILLDDGRLIRVSRK